MTEQDLLDNKTPEQTKCKEMLFLKIFQGFRTAVQPGKLILAILAVLTLFVGGWILDVLTTAASSARVVSRDGVTELQIYTQGVPPRDRSVWLAQRDEMQQANEEELVDLITGGLINMDALAQKRDPDSTPPWANTARTQIRDNYRNEFSGALALLKENYQARRTDIDERYSGTEISDRAEQRTQKEELDSAFEDLFDALLNGEAGASMIDNALDQMLITGDQDRQQVHRTVQLAQAYNLAQVTAGKGIFQTFVYFKLERLHSAVHELVWKRDLVAAKSQIYQLLTGACWLCRFHPIYTAILFLFVLTIWSIFGGAICRMAALQTARDERIGAYKALQFSSGKFASFFSAPLIPLGIIILIAAFIFIGGLFGAIPYIGEIGAGIFTGLALIGGFVIALVAVGLTGGFYLMYPTIAVEGSDSFDAISRSFSYIFARPWRTGFYLIVAAVYGAICYLFVRLFVFLLLLATHLPARIMNIDSSFMIGPRGKLEAIWPAPTFANLSPEFWDINWSSLNGTEMFGAFCIWIWVTIAAAAVLGFVVSYFFSANTIIYYLLRKHVDATEMEDVFVDQDVDDLLSPPALAEETPPETTAKKTKRAQTKAKKTTKTAKTAKKVVKKVKRKKPPSR